jgi:hypothetical protein
MAPFHPYHRPEPRRLERKAIASFVLGIASLLFGGFLTGLPAIILGATARKDIDQSGGHLEGRGLAATGIVGGFFGTGFGVILALWVVSAFVTRGEEPPLATMPADTITASPPETAPPPVPSGVRAYGSLEVVDLDASRPLRGQLAEVLARTPRERTVVIQTYVSSSAACKAIAGSLSDARMQKALADVTLVRVDVEEYDRELAHLHIETRMAPSFYKLDAKGMPTEAISADAWGASVPENMAPVLGTFMARRAEAGHARAGTSTRKPRR